MAGHGPRPSNPATRRRRNDATKDFKILPAEGFKGKYPELAVGYDVDVTIVEDSVRTTVTETVLFRDETREWYADLATSPMATEYLKSDWNHLRWILAPLFDGYLRSPRKDTAAEIRLQQARFGVTIADRQERRWLVQSTPEAVAGAAAARPGAAKKKAAAAKDRRKRLTAPAAKRKTKASSS
jgi:hypothetical protein